MEAGATAGFACATVDLSLFLLVVGANHDCTLSELPISIVGGGLLASTVSYIAVIGINTAMAHPIVMGIAAVNVGLTCTESLINNLTPKPFFNFDMLYELSSFL